MDAPARRRGGNETVHAFSQDENGQNLTYPIDKPLFDESWIVVLDESAQSPVTDGADVRVTSVSRYFPYWGVFRLPHQ